MNGRRGQTGGAGGRNRSLDERFGPCLPFDTPTALRLARAGGVGAGRSHGCVLTFTVRDLRQALRPFVRLLGRHLGQHEALLSLEGTALVISTGGIATSLPASGSWAGEVRVSLSTLRIVARHPPAAGLLTLEVDGGWMRFGGYSTPCVSQNAWRSEIPVPIDLDHLGALRLLLTYSRDRIERAGLAGSVERAQDWWDGLVLHAAEVLAPLGIEREKLDEMLIGWFRTRSGV